MGVVYIGIWGGLGGFLGMVFLGLDDGIWMFPKNRGF